MGLSVLNCDVCECIKIVPLKSLTALLNLPELGPLRLDFLITEESDGLYIRCLDFGIMSRGDTIDECQENIREAIMIYLEDLPNGQSLFNPAPAQYWQMFYERGRLSKLKTTISLLKC